MTTEKHTHIVLVVGADRVHRDALADNLSADGYEVLTAGSAGGARQVLANNPVDLLVVDRELPDGNGLELLRHVRESAHPASRVDCGMPVVLTAERVSELERIRAFESRCDAYLGRGELSYAELRVRVAALLWRRTRTSRGARIRVGALEIDALAHKVWIDGATVALAAKEFSLLLALAREPGRVCRREELMETVWGWSDGRLTLGRTRTLDSHASRLRRKLSIQGDCYVLNVWGVGYRLIEPEPGRSDSAFQFAA